MTWLTSIGDRTKPSLFTNDIPMASDTYYSTHLNSPKGKIAKRIGDTSKPCGTPASTVCLSVALPMSIISTILTYTILSINRVRFLSICLSNIKWTTLPCAMLGEADVMSMRSKPVI